MKHVTFASMSDERTRRLFASTPFATVTEDPSASVDLHAKMEAGGDERAAAFSALRGNVVDFSCDALGCRVVELALAAEGGPERILDEVLASLMVLAKDPCGCRVVESAIEHGSEEQRHRIAMGLQENILRLSTHLAGSAAVRKALLCSPEADQQALANALLSTPSRLATLSENPSGCRVVLTLLRLPVEISGQAVEQLDNVSMASPISWRAKEVLFALRRHCTEG